MTPQCPTPLPEQSAAILVAAGSGQRLGAERPKALVAVQGRTLLEWALDALLSAGVTRIVVVGPPQALAETVDLSRRPGANITVVPGGQTRQQSVSAGLAALGAEPYGYLLVHDAARALTPPAVIHRVDAALRAGARVAVPAIAVVDTLRARAGGVVDRSALVAVQTPQGFHREVLIRAHSAESGVDATDDALLAEALGEQVALVEGDSEAFKITTPLDLLLAEAVLARRQRAGSGSDVGGESS